MEFRQLRYFVAVADEGNIGRAALRLNISQPPVTRQIQALEYELGTKLFVRTPQGGELTESGKDFYRDAQNILANARNAVDRSRAVERGRTGRHPHADGHILRIPRQNARKTGWFPARHNRPVFPGALRSPQPGRCRRSSPGRFSPSGAGGASGPRKRRRRSGRPASIPVRSCRAHGLPGRLRAGRKQSRRPVRPSRTGLP